MFFSPKLFLKNRSDEQLGSLKQEKRYLVVGKLNEMSLDESHKQHGRGRIQGISLKNNGEDVIMRILTLHWV